MQPCAISVITYKWHIGFLAVHKSIQAAGKKMHVHVKKVLFQVALTKFEYLTFLLPEYVFDLRVNNICFAVSKTASDQAFSHLL